MQNMYINIICTLTSGLLRRSKDPELLLMRVILVISILLMDGFVSIESSFSRESRVDTGFGTKEDLVWILDTGTGSGTWTEIGTGVDTGSKNGMYESSSGSSLGQETSTGRGT